MGKPQIKLAQTQDIGLGSFLVIENDLIGNFMLRHGFWEKHIYDIYSKFLTPESIVIDAGANIGFHTVHLAKLSKLVYAFEPQSIIFNILSTNILLNNVSDKIKQYCLGLGDKKTKLYMESEEKYMETDTIYNFGGRGLTNEPSDSEEINLIKWDEEFNYVDKIDFIKMDIQGSEIYALKGMENILIKNKPWMLLENYLNENDKLVLDYILSLGYTVYRPMNYLPNEDCICVHNHFNIEEYLKTLPIEFKIYKNG
jgi:FkbM family methyltransferase